MSILALFSILHIKYKILQHSSLYQMLVFSPDVWYRQIRQQSVPSQVNHLILGSKGKLKGGFTPKFLSALLNETCQNLLELTTLPRHA